MRRWESAIDAHRAARGDDGGIQDSMKQAPGFPLLKQARLFQTAAGAPVNRMI